MKHIIIGEKYVNLLESSFKKFGFEIIALPPNPDINEYLACHTDLSCFYSGTLFLAPYLKETDFAIGLTNLGIKIVFPNIKQSKKYPKDVQFNVFSNKYACICNKKTASDDIVNILSNCGGMISVKQGYANCCCIGVGDRGIITSDLGIYNAIKESDFFDNPLLISQGNIKLPGFDYGFIGGSAINIDDNIIAFTGKFDHHPDRDEILKYLEDNDVEAVFLTDKDIFDIGGAIVL